MQNLQLNKRYLAGRGSLGWYNMAHTVLFHAPSLFSILNQFTGH